MRLLGRPKSIKIIGSIVQHQECFGSIVTIESVSAIGTSVYDNPFLAATIGSPTLIDKVEADSLMKVAAE